MWAPLPAPSQLKSRRPRPERETVLVAVLITSTVGAPRPISWSLKDPKPQVTVPLTDTSTRRYRSRHLCRLRVSFLYLPPALRATLSPLWTLSGLVPCQWRTRSFLSRAWAIYILAQLLSESRSASRLFKKGSLPKSARCCELRTVTWMKKSSGTPSPRRR